MNINGFPRPTIGFRKPIPLVNITVAFDALPNTMAHSYLLLGAATSLAKITLAYNDNYSVLPTPGSVSTIQWTIFPTTFQALPNLGSRPLHEAVDELPKNTKLEAVHV